MTILKEMTKKRRKRMKEMSLDNQWWTMRIPIYRVCVELEMANASESTKMNEKEKDFVDQKSTMLLIHHAFVGMQTLLYKTTMERM